MDWPSLLAIPGGLTIVAILGLLTWILTKKSKSGLPFPPGPKPLPLIGNLLDIPHEKEWLVYQQWAKIHGELRSQSSIVYLNQLKRMLGEIMHVKAFGQHIIILNSARGTRDLFERRSAIYSSRPNAVMMSQL